MFVLICAWFRGGGGGGGAPIYIFFGSIYPEKYGNSANSGHIRF